MALTNGVQLRAARAMLRLDLNELARLAGIAPNTLRTMESSDGRFSARVATIRAVESVLTERGIRFFNDNEPGARWRRPD